MRVPIASSGTAGANGSTNPGLVAAGGDNGSGATDGGDGAGAASDGTLNAAQRGQDTNDSTTFGSGGGGEAWVASASTSPCARR